MWRKSCLQNRTKKKNFTSSSIFSAAIHDGKLAKANGGPIYFRIKPFAQEKFTGSDQHGISSSDAVKEETAMVFDSGHLGCEDGWFQEIFQKNSTENDGMRKLKNLII